jgi:hypothetical protein
LKSRGVTNLGTVEIRTDAGWVQVCDDEWDKKDALVVCREQNYNNGTALTGSKLGKVSTHDSMPNVAFRLNSYMALHEVSVDNHIYEIGRKVCLTVQSKDNF